MMLDVSHLTDESFHEALGVRHGIGIGAFSAGDGG